MASSCKRHCNLKPIFDFDFGAALAYLAVNMLLVKTGFSLVVDVIIIIIIIIITYNNDGKKVELSIL